MAKQTINQGTAPTGAGGDTFRSGSAKLQANDDELYAQLGANAQGVLPAALPVTKGGTGATTVATARTALGLGDAATRSVGTSAGNVMQVGAFGFGAATRTTMPNPALQAPVEQLNITQMYSFGDTGHIGYAAGLGWSQGSKVHFVVGGLINTRLYHVVVADKNAEPRSVGYHEIRTGQNTTVDSNGFLKNASPIVQLFSDKIEMNDEAQQQNIEFEKLGVGDYLIKNSSGFAQEGWYVEQPKDANGNVYHAVVYEQLENGDISVKTYEQKLDGVKIVADLEKPVDIKENRFISIRLQELPQEPIEEPQPEPTIVDNEGNPAPSRLHELVDGTWTISSENAAILENERLSAMPALTRRQFRLALATNGYNLADIETLINSIEDPMQRQITMIEWQDATVFERNNSNLLTMSALMGLSTEQVDALWSQALTF
nr:phage tail protein [Acinetobacter indicus]